MKIPIDPIIFAPIITWIYKLWVATLHFEIHGDWEPLLQKNRNGDLPLVLSIFHGELFPLAGFAPTVSSRTFAVISQSKDGEFITRVLGRMGIGAVRGSSSRGGVKALLQAARLIINENRIAVFTIDGPRGPRHKAKDGVIFMTQRAGAKLVPIRAYCDKKKVFDKSWDHFNLPMPFSRCRIYFGEPFEVTTEKLEKDVMAKEKERLEKVMLSLGPNEE